MTYRCDLCWTEFDSPVELLYHEAADDDRVWMMPDRSRRVGPVT